MWIGAGGAIELAGLAVLIDYFVGGIIALLVTMLFAEMVVAIPVSGSFQVYAKIAFHHLMGFLTGLTYWFVFLIGPASEAIAAGTFLHLWFPTIAVWKFCFLIATTMIINMISAHFFGEIEFWLSLIKVIALLGFIILGLLALGIPMHQEIKSFNLSPFAPHGLNGIINAALLVIFAYGGVE
ncbi:amino acid permease [Legionella oakridgensis]|nr:putative membrane protein [Legionella longbeachae D-4968]UAK47986.1 amino acid permease [Legionella longbeachae]VEE01532.1 amino acid permease [Legionella oakridgensis]HBD7396294.1 amino acid permease [Legionella pneumophila]